MLLLLKEVCMAVSLSPDWKPSVFQSSFSPRDVLYSSDPSCPAGSLTPAIESAREIMEGKRTLQKNDTEILKELFGREVVERVVASGIGRRWPETLERKHLLEILAAIGHSVTSADLQSCWDQLRENALKTQILSMAGINPAFGEDSTVLNNYPLLEQLPPDLLAKYMGKLLAVFRNPLEVLQPGGEKPLWDELQSLGSPTDRRCLAYTRCDSSMQKALLSFQKKGATASTSPQGIAEKIFVGAEVLAKIIGYAKPETVVQGMIVSVLRTENEPEIIYYELKSQWNKEGLHAYVFAPINRPEMPLQLVFRGTAGTHSAQRDFDNSGAGKIVFERYASALTSMLEGAMKFGTGLEIAGHSLGAVDAQRMVALLVDLRAKGEGGVLDRIPSIKVFGFCSPKVDLATVDQWKKNLQILADNGNPPQIELNFAEHESDGVTLAGDMNLPSANAKFVSSTLLSVSSDLGLASTVALHTTPFFKDGIFDFAKYNRSFTLYRDLESELVELEAEKAVAEKIQVIDIAEEELDTVLVSRSSAENEEEARIIKRLKELEEAKAKVDSSSRGWAQRSWIGWSVSNVIGFTIKNALYYGSLLVNAVVKSAKT